MNIRELVLDTIMEIDGNGVPSHVAVKNLLDRYAELEKQKRAQITREIEGTVEKRLALDLVIGRFSKIPPKKMKPVILNILRMSVYELFFMDGVPVHATVNEAVKLAGKKGLSGLKGFVNGVLRSIDRNRDQIDWQDPVLRYSCPEWIMTLWEKSYGEEKAEEIAEAFLALPGLTVSVNTIRISPEKLVERLRSEGVEAKPFADAPDSLALTEVDRLVSLPSFREGLFFVQDLRSAEAVRACELHPGMKILDACASPGGKSFALYTALNGEAMITACDLTEKKTERLAENRDRLGFDGIRIEKQDALSFREEWEGAFDLVVADLPCSGLGVLHKKTDLKYRMSPEQIKELEQLQKNMLRNLKKYVRPHGSLLFSTCTLNPGENERNTIWFKENEPDFELRLEKQSFPEAGHGDGFYYVLFRGNK